MLKFVHRKHFNKLKGEAKIVVYYSLSEIILGLLLVVLVTFFAMDYLKNNLYNSASKPAVASDINVSAPPTKTMKGK